VPLARRSHELWREIEAAVAAQLELARRGGAQLRLGEHVERWTASAQGVTVVTDAGTYVSDQLLLCAGPWIGELFSDGRDTFAVYRQLLYWFPIRQGYPQLRDIPAFDWDFGGEQQAFVHLDGFYGFQLSTGQRAA
jgi:glycine/D-amino acid oxidase-like deaminating enzyme